MYQENFIQRALDLASRNIACGGGPFGAVIVRDGQIIAEGVNHVTLDNDPTAHAEVSAIRAAASQLHTFDLSGCELYASCEPCPMCLGAIYWAHISRVFYAATRTDAAGAGFDDSLIYNELALPIPQRSIPMLRVAASDALAPFALWDACERKTRY